MPDFKYTEILPLGEDQTTYRKISDSGFKLEKIGNYEFLSIDEDTIKKLTFEAIHDCQHYLRTAHLKQLRKILDDPEASNNDKFVALDLLKNANISAGGVLPMCQDTGTVIITGKKGSRVLTNFHDDKVVSEGVFDAYQKLNLRYSQLAPLSMWEEKNTGTNLPAQIEIFADSKPGHELEYSFMFMAKGGGSANKSLMYQETKALLNPEKLDEFLDEKLRLLGTAACPPYHLAIVIGGTSAEYSLKVAKLATTRALDSLPTKDAFSIVRGTGKRKIAVFEDPNCGYCKRFEKDLQKLDNITVYLFLYPILSADSMDKAKNIWCSKDRAKSWQDWMIKAQTPPGSVCESTALQRNLEYGKKHKISGTPTILLADGSRVPGAIEAKELEKLLQDIK